MERKEARNRGYRSLIAWQASMDFAVRVLDLCDVIPVRTGAGVVSQLRRSVVSVPSNIAEGYDRPGPEQLVYLRHAAAACRLESSHRSDRL
jgi:four helix bundle protein